MLRRILLVGGLVLAPLPAARPAAAAPLEPARFEAALSAAKAYAIDRTLLFYCLREKTELLPFLYLGLQADIEAALEKLRAAGSDARQNAALVQAVLANVQAAAADTQTVAQDAECTVKDVERSYFQLRGVGRPLALRPPFDRMGR